MRGIRFDRELIDAICMGVEISPGNRVYKTQTLRSHQYPPGIYIVEESMHAEGDTGVRIRITEMWEVEDLDTYILTDYAKEGFATPADMVMFMKRKMSAPLDKYRWAHKFDRGE